MLLNLKTKSPFNTGSDMPIAEESISKCCILQSTLSVGNTI